MTLSYATSLRNTREDAIATAIGNAGIFKIYSGSVPANVGASLGAAVLCAQLTCGTPFAGSSSGGVLTANAISTESSADASGTASFFRITTSGGTAVVQGSVGTSGTDLVLNTTSIVAGASVAITSCTITEGNA